MEARILELEKLRGLSILAVILIHATVRSMNSYEANESEVVVLAVINLISRFAVPAFLVISGFLITKQELAADGNVAGIHRNRAERVLPPYVVWSTVYFMLFVMTGEQYATHQSLFMIYMEKLVTGRVGWHLYFLVLILQFYFLSFWGLGRKGQLSVLTLTLCGLAQVTFILLSYIAAFKNNIDSEFMRRALLYFQRYQQSCFPMFVLYFVFGRWLGANYQEVEKRLHQNQRLLAAALLMSGAFAFWEFWLMRTHGAVILPADWTVSVNIYAFLFILYILPRLKAVKQPTVNYLLIRLGALSFVLYLLHEPLLGYLVRAISKYVPYNSYLKLLILPVVLITSILISYVIYRICVIVLPSLWLRIIFGIKRG